MAAVGSESWRKQYGGLGELCGCGWIAMGVVAFPKDTGHCTREAVVSVGVDAWWLLCRTYYISSMPVHM